jgi:hypothetical protein
MRVHLRWTVATACGAVLWAALAPAGAHVGDDVDHLWRRHISSKLGSIRPCPQDSAIHHFTASAQAVCDGVEVISGFHDDSVTLSAQEPVEVASLSLSGGAYAISAKAIVGPPGAGNPQNRTVRCILAAEGDSDEARATTDSTDPWATIAMNVVHEFSGPGQAVLRCGFVEGGTNQKPVSHVKITAVRVAEVQNSAI